MKKYKPTYLGKAIPADDTPEKLTDFVIHKYDAFSRIYETCRDESENITDIKTTDLSDTSMSMEITAQQSTINNIQSSILASDVSMTGNIITAKITL